MAIFKEDWLAAMDSEIFREYVKAELDREAQEKIDEPLNMVNNLETQLDEELQTYAELEAFQKQVDASPVLKEYFKKCRALLTNEDLRSKVDPNFINGIELLNLGK